MSFTDRLLRESLRPFVYLRYKLVQERRLGRPVLENVAGRSLVILPGVFHPKIFHTGRFMAECLDSAGISAGATVLDLGTGSGIGAVVVAPFASRVVAVDISARAARCARINASVNAVDDKIDVRCGDLFDPVVGERFDIVLFNPPFLSGTPRSDFERAFRSNGMPARFASRLGNHLKEGGQAILALSSEGLQETYLNALKLQGFHSEPFSRRRVWGEVLRLFLVTRSAPSPSDGACLPGAASSPVSRHVG